METTILVNKNTEGKMFVERISLKPGETAVFNSENDLFYFVISGYGYMNVETYGYNLEPETSVFIPFDAEYSLVNTGETELVIVCYGVK